MAHRDGHSIKIYLQPGIGQFEGRVFCPHPKPTAYSKPETWPSCWRSVNDGKVNTEWTDESDRCLVEEWWDESDSIWSHDVDWQEVRTAPIPIEWWYESDSLTIAPMTAANSPHPADKPHSTSS